MAVKLIDLQLLYGIAGARDKFEDLCAKLVRSELPTATSIRVHRGDGGVDVYNGEFTDSEGIHVFQVKFFPGGLGKSQWDEVKKSFIRCRTNTEYTAKKWTLCLPVDLSIEETKRFSQWVENEAEYGIDIDWWGATKLESLLYRDDNRGIKEAFFKEEHLTQIREMHEMLRKLVDDFTERSVKSSKETTELCQNYRNERLGKIKSGEIPIKLDPVAPKIVLHIVPFRAFELFTKPRLGLLTQVDNVRLLEPLRLSSGGFPAPHYNFDGLLVSVQDSYTQIFRNGSIESVDTSILSASRERRFTSGSIYETRLLQAMKRYLNAQQRLDVELPLLVMVSLLGVKGYAIRFDINDFFLDDHQIDRSNLIASEILIDSYDCDLAGIMKPIFDTIANAAKWSRSMNYSEDGKSLLADLE